MVPLPYNNLTFFPSAYGNALKIAKCFMLKKIRRDRGRKGEKEKAAREGGMDIERGEGGKESGGYGGSVWEGEGERQRETERLRDRETQWGGAVVHER